MTNLITIREYDTKDKNEVINLIRLNTPEYFAVDEEEDLNKYLETERELYYVLLYDQKLVGCGGINFADNNTTGKITVRTSQVAYKFYEKQGFELFEIKKDYWAEGFDMYNMEYKQKSKL